MTTPSRKPRSLGPKYPTKKKIAYLVDALTEAAKNAGVKVNGFECGPDGTVRVIQKGSAPANSNTSDYDEWKASQGA